MAKGITREALQRQVASNPVVQKYAKRIGLLESARKAVGAKPMSTFEKFYAGQLFENIAKGNLYEGYTQPAMVNPSARKDAFNIVSIAIQNTILPEIVSVQPMTTAAQLVPILQIKYGTNKGATQEGDLALNSLAQGKTDMNYDSNKLVGETTMIDTTGGKNVLPYYPVIAGSIKITKDDGTVVTDDGNGKLSDNGTVDYANGVVTTTSVGKMEYKYDNSMVPNTIGSNLDVGDLTMDIDPVLVEAEEHKIRTVYALTAAYRINKEYGVNMPLEFEKQVANELNKERERVVMNDLFTLANGGSSIVWSATPRPRSK